MENETHALALPDEAQFRRDIQAINRFQEVVHATMIRDLDYGVIPGTQKPTLLKPGAEKIAKLLGLSDQYEIMDKTETWTTPPLFRYLIKCKLIHVATGAIISEGLGECNSMEAKYRWRDSKRKCPVCGQETIIKGKEEYGGGWLCFKKQGGCGTQFESNDVEIIDQKVGRIENDDIYSQVNTILKMSKKRALVDAALSAGRLSDVFTQDMEDLGKIVDVEPVKSKPVKPSAHTNIPKQPVKPTVVDSVKPDGDCDDFVQWAKEQNLGRRWPNILKDIETTYGISAAKISDAIRLMDSDQKIKFHDYILSLPE